MLTMTISLDDAKGPWTCTDGAWTSRTSIIEPVAHPALEAITDSSGDVLRITVRERCPGRDGEPHQGDWPGDFLTAELSARMVLLHAGRRGSAPLYVATDGLTLRGSWDLAALRPAISADRLTDREVARLLTMRFRYGHETLFAEARQLTERSSAQFTDDGLTLRYPVPALHGRARELRPGADAVAAYERLLESAITSRAYDPDTACVELSGGLDSANFTPVMRQAVREHGLPLISRMLSDGSALIDHGFIDPDGLASVYRRLALGGEFRERETELYGAIAIDLALRTFA